MRTRRSSIFSVIAVIFVTVSLLAIAGSCVAMFGEHGGRVKKESVLLLHLEGPILDGKQILKQIRKYAKKDKIKAVVVQIDSPGGVVGPSQEIFAELKRVRSELNKPVVAACRGVAASGAYYVALGADKVVVNPGTLMGSIGVIMGFVNLQGLYEWAKVERYSITTGPYKDSGAEYRPIRDDERQYFQDLIDEVHSQFKKHVADSRELGMDVVEQYSDGRVFTGETAVKIGFADKVGSFHDALMLAGELAGLEGEPEIFAPPKGRQRIFEMFMDGTEASINDTAKKLLGVELAGKPLSILPGYVF